jgi:poly-beta-1,6-N-acetyl-D-glucosamine synthase
VFLFIHSYIFYPVIIRILSLFKREKLHKPDPGLKVSILIAAYNEEKVIANRVKNISTLNYDFNRLEVIVGSDGSSDSTSDILLNLSEEYNWLKVKIFQKRRGKAAVLNDLVKESNNSILVFTDANSSFNENALTELLTYYGNPKVGGISGRLILEEPLIGFNKTNREKTYWEYETFLKRYEGKLGILIGANGGIYSVRKELFTTIPSDKAVTDDLYITLSVLNQKFQFKYAYNAVAREEVSRELQSEFKRKIRFASTNFQTLSLFKGLLFSNNFLLSFAFWSHKVLRWFMPFILIAGLILNYLLIPHGTLYLNLFILQVCIYIISIIGYLLSVFKIRIPLVTLLFFFNLTNIALLIGFINFLSGKHKSYWESTPR